ncbi:hypothetical protein K1719_015583 [Acacia pycnantha]|nr:hypothetical protein K1719_015583 [Acacia pycnantha]
MRERVKRERDRSQSVENGRWREREREREDARKLQTREHERLPIAEEVGWREKERERETGNEQKIRVLDVNLVEKGERSPTVEDDRTLKKFKILDSEVAKDDTETEGNKGENAAAAASCDSQDQMLVETDSAVPAINVEKQGAATTPHKGIEASLNYAGYSDPRPNYAEVILIRHGETVWNPDRLQGQLDILLNRVGIALATRVAESLSRERKVSAVYSSDLKRAYETAQIIATKCGLLEVVIDPDLRERHLGVLQGMSRCEAPKTNPTAFEAMDRGQEIPGGGESVDQLSERCTSALQRIGMKHLGKRVAVVIHGGVIRALCKRVNTESLCRSILKKRPGFGGDTTSG